MMKNKILILFAAILMIAMFIILLRLVGGEDYWMCVKGKWEQHGNPSAPQPTEQCK
jgi:hypothetical protein